MFFLDFLVNIMCEYLFSQFLSTGLHLVIFPPTGRLEIVFCQSPIAHVRNSRILLSNAMAAGRDKDRTIYSSRFINMTLQ
jgi:hypothetical protein